MIDGLKPYPEYKDSCVAQLGEVPKHWSTEPIARIGQLLKGRGGSKEDEQTSGVPCVRYGDLYTRHEFFIHSAKAYVSPERASAYTSIRPGDLLFAASGETFEDIGRSAVNLLEGDAVCGGDVILLRPTRDVNLRFLGYATDSLPSRNQKAMMGRGFTVVHIYGSALKRLTLAIPPLDEQTAIARFIDHAEARIRRYIAAKQKLIKLLEEEKRAIVHRIITHGLNPNVKLKPSGVEWLGNVPAHWEIKRLHQITDPRRPVMYGIVLPGPNVDDGVFIVKGGNCEPGKLRADKLARTTREIEGRYARSRLQENDIVFAIRGGVGAAEIVPPELAGANVTQDAARIAPDTGIDPRWLLHAVRAPIFQEHAKARMVGATVRGINIRDLKRIELAVPPSGEQTDIVRHLEVATADLSAAIGRASSEISLLREFRTRLIADVVTGKLDVREAAAKLPDEVPAPVPLDEIDDLPQDEESAEMGELEADDAA